MLIVLQIQYSRNSLKILSENQESLFFHQKSPADNGYNYSGIFENGKPVRRKGSMILKNNIHRFDHFLVPLSYENGCVQSVLGIPA
jgi:hypothetical protein